MAGANRTGVYWGAEPYPKGHEGFETPYPGWQQAHARDLGDGDFNALLKSAREWLQQPMLKEKTEGLIPDIRMRAALDLAIQTTGDGKYGAGLHPEVYNTLLARLAGVSGAGTLLTIREASVESVYHPRRERTTMRASARIRQFAKKFATENPENTGLAFDLLDLASKVAEDEKEAQGQDQGGQGQQKQGQDQGQEAKDQGQAQQKQGGEMPPALKEHMEEKKKEEGGDDQGQQKQAYTQLKAACLTAARNNPNQRAAYMPILRVIKQLG